MTETTPPLGLIEGYFGDPWTWTEREHVMRTLAPRGFSFFIYAPKADAYLRRQWQEDHPAEAFAALEQFAQACRDAGVAFGIGLTPYELHSDWNGAGKAALTARLKTLGRLKPVIVAILFDDMHGDIPGLAETQADIVHHAASVLPARMLMCPSYYSDDPVLDRVFGARPARYLEDLGRLLDPSVDVFWTGEEVCSREFTRGHLDRVAGELRRKPVLWDNYPVNDGPRMSRFLHLRAFTGRHGIAGSIAGHAANPALQPWLTLTPAITLAMSYAQGDAYRYGAAFIEAARECYGSELAAALEADLLTLNDSGLDRIPGERCTALRAKYKAFEHPAGEEVARFLEGGYLITGEAVQTQ